MKEALALIGISKDFPGTRALDDISLTVNSGEIHALVGENGAGKSTLIKIVAGVLASSAGEMVLHGAPYRPRNAHDAASSGVSIVSQEHNLVSDLTVAENIYLNCLSNYTAGGTIQWKRLSSHTQEGLNRLGIPVRAERPVLNLSAGQRKLVEFARAALLKPKVMLVDEITAYLGATEVDIVFRHLRELADQGTAIIYISHRLEEVMEICDRVTVLKDGRHVTTANVADASADELPKLMVGRDLELATGDRASEKNISERPVALEVDGLSRLGSYEEISLELHEGEIIGIAGLTGCGSEELLKTLFGLVQPDSGRIRVSGADQCVSDPSQAISLGMAYVPKERDIEGLIGIMSVKENMTLPILQSLRKSQFLLDGQREAHIVEKYRSAMAIRTPSIHAKCESLSGGNRQKVVLGKWLSAEPRIFLLNNPTRGVDVGAKAEIYGLLESITSEGRSVILVSEELSEIIRMSDTIVVMRHGRVSSTLPRGATEHEIISYMV